MQSINMQIKSNTRNKYANEVKYKKTICKWGAYTCINISKNLPG